VVSCLMRTGAAQKLDPPPPDPEGRTPEDFLEEIRQILQSGTLRGAREVAEEGLAFFPDHPQKGSTLLVNRLVLLYPESRAGKLDPAFFAGRFPDSDSSAEVAGGV
jgi:hypothetical protein